MTGGRTPATSGRDGARPARRPGLRFAGIAVVLGAWACAGDSAPGLDGVYDDGQVARSSGGVVVAAHPLAAEAGADMLRRGGNAADAAVAAAFAVSVVEPSMNSIGGRTQILVRLPDGAVTGIDATTQAPPAYDPETAPRASYGYPTVGVPGAVAGLTRLLREHGTLPLNEVMAPAIELAGEGFRLLPGEAARHAAGAERLAEFRGSRVHFLTRSGESRKAGSLFLQPYLAATLAAIAAGGADAFYRGPIAERIVADLAAHGSSVTARALAEYRALAAPVVRGSYRGYELVGTDIPASGAATIGILHILEHFDMSALDADSWAGLVGTAVARAFEERAAARSEGVPDLAFMTGGEWAAGIAATIDVPGAVRRAAGESSGIEGGGQVGRGSTESAVAAGRAGSLAPGAGGAMADWDSGSWGPADGHTTHLSTGDADGMYVALTQTIGPSLGSGVATEGLGFLHAATLGGYLGRMEPGQRARSSISPLMVLRDGEPVLVLGAAGGARIISAVVQTVLRVVDQGMTLPEALAAARVHPVDGGVAMETSPGIGWAADDVAEVRSWGMAVEEVEREGAFGRIHGIGVDPVTGELVGVADPDWEGAAVAVGAPGR